MKKYEMMFIVNPTLDESNIKKTAEEIKTTVEKANGKVLELKDMGQRELAYEINKFKTGYYFFYEVEADALAIAEFNRVVGINECVLRHLVVKKED